MELAVERLPECSSGYSFDLTSTRVRALWPAAGRPARPNSAQAWTARFIRWWRCWPEYCSVASAGCAAATAASFAALWNFLVEALALLPEKWFVWCAPMRAFDQQLLGLNKRGLSYIVVARLTRMAEAWRHVTQWRAFDEHYAVGEFSCNCWVGTAPAASS